MYGACMVHVWCMYGACMVHFENWGLSRVFFVWCKLFAVHSIKSQKPGEVENNQINRVQSKKKVLLLFFLFGPSLF